MTAKNTIITNFSFSWYAGLPYYLTFPTVNDGPRLIPAFPSAHIYLKEENMKVEDVKIQHVAIQSCPKLFQEQPHD